VKSGICPIAGTVSDFDFYFLIVIDLSFCIVVPNFDQIAIIINFTKSVVLKLNFAIQ